MADSVAQVKDASIKIEEIQGQVMTSLESISSSTEENAAGTEEVSENSEEVMTVIMPFKYTDGKENSLYAWRAFSYGKKIEIFC